MMARKTTKQKTLEHYDRMIAWAEKQPKKRVVSNIDMMFEIHENWDGIFCSYCRSIRKPGCGSCKLQSEKGCCDNLYREMHSSKTWGAWVKSAKKVREYIEVNG
jgi:hypothetical protein